MPIIIAALLCVLVYFGQRRFFLRHWADKLSVSLHFKEQGVSQGELCTLQEVIENKKKMPLPALQVKFKTTKSFVFQDDKNGAATDYYYRNDMFCVGGRQRILRSLPVCPQTRGYFTIDEIQMSARDYFFSEKYARKFSNETELYVYPRKLDFLPFQQQYQQIMGELEAKSRLIEDPFCFRGIRPYQPYDTMHQINWKSSARNGDLLVNTYDTSYSQEVCMILNVKSHAVFKKSEVEEFSIAIISTLAAQFLRAGIPVSVYTNGRDIETEQFIRIGKGAGEQHLLTIDRNLARLDLKKEPGSYLELVKRECSGKNPLVQYILVSSEHSRDWTEYFIKLQEEIPDICQIVPEAKNETWDLLDGMVGWEVEEFDGY